MRHIIIFATLFFLTNSSVAQDNCSCRQIIQTVISKIDANYADRENIKRNKYYQKVKREFDKIIIPQSYDSCAVLVHKLVSPFKDKHITFRIDREQGAFTKIIYDSSQSQAIYSRLSKLSTVNKSIEGVWITESKENEYFIVKDRSSERYNVIVWKSTNKTLKTGQLKGFFLHASNNKYIYVNYLGGSAIIAISIEKRGGTLYSLTTGLWRKKINENRPAVKQSLAPTFQVLSDTVTILTLPSFDPLFKPIIDSLLKTNNLILSRTKVLIIDMRINYGGSTQTYQSVLPWIYTNPIKIESGLYYSSPENIEIKKRFFVSRTDSGSRSWRSAKNLIERMEKTPNYHIIDSGYIIKYDSVYKYPEKVHILIGERCLSAGELFLITAQQSKKVKIFGENTYGSIDRADAVDTKTNCKNFRMTIPIALRKFEVYKKPIDNIGIIPDVRIPSTFNWIEFVLKYKQK